MKQEILEEFRVELTDKLDELFPKHKCKQRGEANLSWANLNGTLYYMGNGNRNFEALCKAIKTIRHQDGKFDDLVK